VKDTEKKENLVSDAEAAAIDILVTAEFVRMRGAELFKDHDLTHAQYNVLRILRGAGREGLRCTEISERMITRDPDVTRMLDRLEARELISRERQANDRRVVLTFISAKGLALLKDLDGPVKKMHEVTMKGISSADLHTLVGILEKIRATEI
jgi:DNA-binding MarR family transcriptional regulator